MAQYQLAIALGNDTLTQLSASGYHLYGLLAAQVGDQQARPLLWSITTLAGAMQIAWTDQYEVFTAPGTSVPASGTVLTPGATQAMTSGELLTVDATGTGTPTTNGTPGVFTVSNASDQEQLCGLMVANQAFCVLPLLSLSGQVFTPLPKVLLFFSTVRYPLGTVLSSWPGTGSTTQGIVVDMSLATPPTVSVGYSTQTGQWSWQDQQWGQAVPFGAEFLPYLLPQSAALARRSRQASIG